MNKSDLTRRIAEKMSVSQKDSLRFISALEEVLANELLQLCCKALVLSLPGNRKSVSDVIPVQVFLS